MIAAKRSLIALLVLVLVLVLVPGVAAADSLWVSFATVGSIEIRGNADDSRANLIVTAYDSGPGTVTVSSGAGLPPVGTTFRTMNFLFNPKASPSLLEVIRGCANYGVLVQRNPEQWRIGFIWEKGEGGFASLDASAGWLALYPGSTSTGFFRCSITRVGPALSSSQLGADVAASVENGELAGPEGDSP